MNRYATFAASFIMLVLCSPCWASTRPLKEDTPVTIIAGPFVDSAGAPQTTLTVANIDCNLYKNNATKVDVTLAASGTSNDCVHVDDGYYSLELTATDTSTPGYLRISFQISGAVVFHEDFEVQPANIYDSWYSTDKLEVDVAQISGSIAAADNLEDTFDETGGSGVAMALESLNVTNPSGNAVTFSSTGGGGIGLAAFGNGGGHGALFQAGATGRGLRIIGGSTSGDAIFVTATDGDGIDIRGGTNGHGFNVLGAGTGHGVLFTSGSGATGNGIQATAASMNGHGFALSKSGTGQAISGELMAANLADGAIDRATFAADTGLQTIRSGTSPAAGSSTSIKLDSSASSINNFYKHNYVLITSGQGAGQYRLITGYTGIDQVATVTPAWITGQEPANGSTFAILPAGITNIEAWLGAPVVPVTVPGIPEVDVTHVGGEPVCN